MDWDDEFITMRVRRRDVRLPIQGKVIGPRDCLPRLSEFIERQSYKPGYEITLVIRDMQAGIRDDDWKMLYVGPDLPSAYLQMKCYIPDSTKPPHEDTLIQFASFVHPTTEEYQEKAMKAWFRTFLDTFEEHERAEWWRMDGELVNNPHDPGE